MAKQTARKKSPRKTATKKATGKSATRFVKSKDKAAIKRKVNASGMVTKRGDFNQPGEVAIDRMPEPSRSIARAADALIRASVPGCECVVKWGNAVYSTMIASDRVAFAALMETRTGINLALPGTAINDPDNLLEGTGKLMRHVKIRNPDTLNHPGVAKLIVAASKVGLPGM